MKKAKSKTVTFSTDDAVFSMATSLVKDLAQYVRDPKVIELGILLSRRKLVEARSLIEGITLNRHSDDTDAFKAEYQLLGFLKKYMFQKDRYSPQDLIDMSKKKFLENQERLKALANHSYSPVTRRVLWEARGWIERVLKDFSTIEHLESCRFARRATVGVPMQEACESSRVSSALSGSHDHIDWFEKLFLAYHGRMRNHLLEFPPKGGRTKECDTLTAVLVPKTWKSLRMIMPNTTIGSLYSDGLGKVITNRLCKAGYDIRTLQGVHRDYAREGSENCHLVTADQSLASDNITSKLLEALLPSTWFTKVNFGRIGRLSFYGETLETPTFMTMGIGFTFPLQTLVFLGLLKGCAGFLGEPNLKVSAFGDDLVYDQALHAIVVEVFDDLGLVLNQEKTFSDGWFRESCGGDFFHGVDVRPWHAPGEGGHLSLRKYQAFLYKCANGLLRRWSIEKVPETIQCIGNLISASGDGKVLWVPDDYPDTAGVRSRYPLVLREKIPDLEMPLVDIHGTARFRYLAFKPNFRSELTHEPYFWNILRCSHLSFGDPPKSRLVPLRDWIDRGLSASPPIFSYVEETLTRGRRVLRQVSQETVRKWSVGRTRESFILYCQKRRLHTAITQVDSGRYLVQLGTSWLQE